MNDIIEHFAGDLRASGVDENDVARAVRLYDCALVTGSESAWRRLYRATFFAMSRSAQRALPRSRNAVESLIRLFSDDLGSALFDARTIAQLHARIAAEAR